MHTETRLEADFLKAWNQFRAMLEACQHALAEDRGRLSWLYGFGITPERDQLVQIVGQIFYANDQGARQSVTLPGIAACSMTTLEAANRLNVSKERLRATLTALDRHTVDERNPQTGRTRKRRLSDLTLPAHGLARMHRMQCYRHLRSVQQRPDKVGLTWARTRRVRHTTVAAIRKELERNRGRGRQAPFIEEDLTRLATLKEDMPLAVVHPEPMHARANLAWKGSGATWTRRQVTLALPLLYPCAPNTPLPEIKPLTDPDQASRRVRREGRRLEDLPYLTTMPVYRYSGLCQ